MSDKEHKEYLLELKSLTEKLLKSKEDSQEFYKSAGIHTKSGNISSVYSETTKIGFKVSKDNR